MIPPVSPTTTEIEETVQFWGETHKCDKVLPSGLCFFDTGGFFVAFKSRATKKLFVFGDEVKFAGLGPIGMCWVCLGCQVDAKDSAVLYFAEKSYFERIEARDKEVGTGYFMEILSVHAFREETYEFSRPYDAAKISK